MNIRDIKAKLMALEMRNDMLAIYEYLHEVWASRKKADISVLIIDEMISFLIFLDTCVESDSEDEYETYELFFREVVEYGLHNHLKNKMFLWLMLYYLSAVGTYYYVCKTSLCNNGSEEALKTLTHKAKSLFPDSIMFKIIPCIQSGNPSWIHDLNPNECNLLHNEMNALNLQDNLFDAKLKALFQIDDLQKQLSSYNTLDGSRNWRK